MYVLIPLSVLIPTSVCACVWRWGDGCGCAGTATLLEQARLRQLPAVDRTLHFVLPEAASPDLFAAVRAQLVALYRAA
jgi:hypothetical protein